MIVKIYVIFVCSCYRYRYLVQHEGVLILILPNGVEIVGFADDVVLAISGETVDDVEMLTMESLDIIELWLTGFKLI